jgi:putative ABC transport system substrate-binding protein
MAIYIRRREFIVTLGGAAAAWLHAARAQQPPMPVIGFLGSRSPEDSANLVAGFHAGLGETGFAENRNVTIEFRWAEGHYDRLPMLAADLVARQVAVIAAPGGIAAGLAVKAATAKIPIIFLTGADPVQFGLVSSLSRPDGNITGVAILTNTLAPKQLELLHEVVPTATLVAFLVNPKNPIAESDTRDLRSAAGITRQQILVLNASNESEIDNAFAAIVQQQAGALLVQSDPFFNSRPDRIVALAARHAIPAMYQWRDFPVAGGLMSYGTILADAYRQVGIYAGRILKGAKPSDLPVQQSVKVQLVINLKTARALGLTFPLPLLGRADEVIE